MSKTIASVGFHLAHDSVTCVNINSHQSLIDWDIIVFTPDFSSLLNRDMIGETYLGKQCLGDDTSFRLREACEHWRREIQEAVSSGKTVIGFLCALTEVYIATGEKEYSGTGRNRQTTRMVTKYSNYQSIPISAEPISRSGSAIKVVEKYNAILTPYWEEFHNCSKFSVTFPKTLKMPAGSLDTETSQLDCCFYKRLTAHCYCYQNFIWTLPNTLIALKTMKTATMVKNLTRKTSNDSPLN